MAARRIAHVSSLSQKDLSAKCKLLHQITRADFPPHPLASYLHTSPSRTSYHHHHTRGATVTTVSLLEQHVNKQQRHRAVHSSQHRLNASSGRKGFFENIIHNIKEGLTKDEKMKESLKQFREEASQLEKSEALKEARKKYESIESESSIMKQRLEEIQKKASEGWEEAQKTEIMRKAGQLGSKVSQSASKVVESAAKKTEALGKTDVFKSVSEGVKAVKDELDDAAKVQSRHYFAPSKLKKRSDLASFKSTSDERHMDADTESTGVVMHKDSRWSQSWQDFKDNNAYVHKMFDLKTKYDESDNIAVRMSRTVTDKIGQLFGSMSKSELSAVLTEIVKIDPNFDREEFIKYCKAVIIPNVLEAMITGDLEVLEDWCFEAPFNLLAQPIRQAKQAGYVFGSKVLDVEHVDIPSGQLMEQGPVLLITFQTQQVMVVYDKTGTVKEGDPEKVLKFIHVWALCRDQNDLDPKSAWRVMEVSAASTEQWL